MKIDMTGKRYGSVVAVKPVGVSVTKYGWPADKALTKGATL